jgi:hypothetical protein
MWFAWRIDFLVAVLRWDLGLGRYRLLHSTVV